MAVFVIVGGGEVADGEALANAVWVRFGVSVTKRFGFVVGELTPEIGVFASVCDPG